MDLYPERTVSDRVRCFFPPALYPVLLFYFISFFPTSSEDLSFSSLPVYQFRCSFFFLFILDLVCCIKLYHIPFVWFLFWCSVSLYFSRFPISFFLISLQLLILHFAFCIAIFIFFHSHIYSPLFFFFSYLHSLLHLHLHLHLIYICICIFPPFTSPLEGGPRFN